MDPIDRRLGFCMLGCVSLPRQVGDRGNCEFWPSRVPTYPHSQLAARSAAIPTYPPSGAEFRERPPSGRAQRYLPTLARCLPAPRPYLPTLAQVFPIAAVTYLPGQRDATPRPPRAAQHARAAPTHTAHNPASRWQITERPGAVLSGSKAPSPLRRALREHNAALPDRHLPPHARAPAAQICAQ